jgi:hypothetical protein
MEERANFGGFLRALRAEWFTAMSGSVSVPFAILAVFVGDTWSKGMLAALSATCFVFAGYRVWKLERERVLELSPRLAPRIALKFDKDSLGLSSAIEGDAKTGKRATYIRIQADALSEVSVRGCTAFITKASRKIEGESSFRLLRLQYSVPLGANPFDVLPGIPKHIDFARTVEGDDQLHILGSWPNVLASELVLPAVYRFTLAVNEGGGRTESIEVSISTLKGWGAVEIIEP